MKDMLLNVGSGGGAAAAPAAGGGGAAAAADAPAEEKKEEKEEGKIHPSIGRHVLTVSQRKRNQTKIWVSVSSTKPLCPFPFCTGTMHNWSCCMEWSQSSRALLQSIQDDILLSLCFAW